MFLYFRLSFRIMTILTTVRCSLDDFVAKNTKEVKMDGIGGLPYDLRILVGRGLQLESTNIPESTDLSKDIGIAHILNKDGTHTGYRLTAYGSRNVETGQRNNGYYIHRGMRPNTFTIEGV